MNLIDFYEKTFWPLRLAGKNAETDRQYRRMIQGLSDVIGKTATIEDLNEKNINAYVEALRYQQCGARKAREDLSLIHI